MIANIKETVSSFVEDTARKLSLAQYVNGVIEEVKKIAQKGCDFLIANDISRKDIGFNSNENEVYIIDKRILQAILQECCFLPF